MGLPVFRTPSPCREPDATQHSRSPIRRRHSPSRSRSAASSSRRGIANAAAASGTISRGNPLTSGAPRVRVASGGRRLEDFERQLDEARAGPAARAEYVPRPPVPDPEVARLASRIDHSRRMSNAVILAEMQRRWGDPPERAPDSPYPYSYIGSPPRQANADGQGESQDSASFDNRVDLNRPWEEYQLDGQPFPYFDPSAPSIDSPDYRAWLRDTRDRLIPQQRVHMRRQRDQLRQERDRLRQEREATAPLETSGAVVDLPPLRRMNRRNVTDGPLPSGLRESIVPTETSPRPATASSGGNADIWDTMFANIVPDANLPSADSSFTSAAASASFSASNTNPSRSHSADSTSATSFRTHVTVPDAPIQTAPRGIEDWTCDTESEGETRRDGEQPRDHPPNVRFPPRRRSGRPSRRQNLAWRLRRTSVHPGFIDMFLDCVDHENRSEHLQLLQRAVDARHAMPRELWNDVMAEIGIYGERTGQQSSDSEGRRSHRSGSSSPLSPSSAAEEEPRSRTPPAPRRPVRAATPPSVSFERRRAALRNARNEQAQLMSRQDEARDAMTGIWDDMGNMLQRFSEAVATPPGRRSRTAHGRDSSPSPERASGEIRRMLDEIGERRRANEEFQGDPIERIRRLRAELDRMGEFVDHLAAPAPGPAPAPGSGSGTGQQRESHL